MGQKLFLVLALISCLAIISVAGYKDHLTGGLGDEKPADKHLDTILSKVTSQIKSKYPREYTKLEPISYKTQIVSGMNYFIKAKVTEASGAIKHVHLRVYRPFNDHLELHGLKTDVCEDTPLRYFQAD